MTDAPEVVAYIMVTWNNRDLLDECIRSIQAQDYPHKKIIMVDNNTTKDDSVAFVRDTFPDVEILEQPDNYGFAKGNNIGIAHAFHDAAVRYVALINTDATLDPHWTSTVVRFAQQRPKAASLQTPTLDYYDHSTLDSTHIYISRNGQGTQGSYRRPLYDTQLDVPPVKVFGCNAAAVVITRHFIEAQPFDTYFDEDFFMYLEDVDVAARATVMGWDNYVVPGARAYHMGSASSGKNPGFSLYMTFRNNSALLLKNIPLRILVPMIPHILRGDIDTVLALRRISKPAAAWKVLKGRLVGLLLLPKYVGKRRVIVKHQQVSDEYLWRLMDHGY